MRSAPARGSASQRTAAARARLAGVVVALLCAGVPAVARADAINPAVPLAIGGVFLLVVFLVMVLVVGVIAWFVLKRIARKRAEKTAADAAAAAAATPDKTDAPSRDDRAE